MTTPAIWLSGLAVAAVMASPFAPIGRAFRDPAHLNDFGAHIENAQTLIEKGVTFPHLLWHAVVVVVHSVLPFLSWLAAAAIVVVGSYGLQGALLAWIVTGQVAQPRTRGDIFAVMALVMCLVIAAPVTVLTWYQKALYHGYLNMDSYASPTHALLKPLALVAFFFTARVFSEERERREGLVLGMATSLSALAKPSLLICLLPATLVLAAVRWLRTQPVRFRYLTRAFLLPCVALLTWQCLVYFAVPGGAPGGSGESSVLWAPFLVMGHYASWLGVKLLLSILLPVVVLFVYRRDVLTDVVMQLAWLQFAFAAGYSYLLAETRVPLAGNFVWSGQIGTYLLFVTSTIFALRQWLAGRPSRVCAGAFALHILCGVVFFAFPYSWGPACAPGTCGN